MVVADSKRYEISSRRTNERPQKSRPRKKAKTQLQKASKQIQQAIILDELQEKQERDVAGGAGLGLNLNHDTTTLGDSVEQ